MPRCVIVSEGGLNHHGSLKLAKQLADHAKASGADIVKFQTYIPDKVLRRTDPNFKLLEHLALAQPYFKRLAKHCEEIGIEFMSTPGDVDSLKFLVEDLGVKRIKIGSDDLTNTKLLQAAGDTQLPIILSTGMATMPEIWDAFCIIYPNKIYDNKITFLHCVSLYPTPIQDANLGAITTMRNELDDYGAIGYSDHTANPHVIATAVALGAEMIEAHLRLPHGREAVDSAVSFSPKGFVVLVQLVRDTETAIGHGRKQPCKTELLHQIPKLRKGSDGLRGVVPILSRGLPGQMDLPL